ncbi:PREDICTED: Retrovirus-related Pol poly from [Prunus dulcis]|uniref:PREDICTED: Retrovirus-related Pol poly from n=1 Tax=Prunus dulcis TaxID=3755 RepID=A0A5E4F6I2_PRUDU|nr:PREDICTED: Retrovirus-related Pol poly from [Prunus dulcis]
MAVTEAIKEVIWLQGLFDDLGVQQDHMDVHYDSQSAIYLSKNQVHHAHTKHIDVRFHFVREIIDEGDILLQKIETSEIMVQLQHQLLNQAPPATMVRSPH